MTPLTLAVVCEDVERIPFELREMPAGRVEPLGSMANTPPRAVPEGSVDARSKVLAAP
jgi:hypothetical protein